MSKSHSVGYDLSGEGICEVCWKPHTQPETRRVVNWPFVAYKARGSLLPDECVPRPLCLLIVTYEDILKQWCVPSRQNLSHLGFPPLFGASLLSAYKALDFHSLCHQASPRSILLAFLLLLAYSTEAEKKCLSFCLLCIYSHREWASKPQCLKPGRSRAACSGQQRYHSLYLSLIIRIFFPFLPDRSKNKLNFLKNSLKFCSTWGSCL